MKKQKGSILLPLLITLLIVSAGGYWYFNSNQISNSNLDEQNETIVVESDTKVVEEESNEIVEDNISVETPKNTQTVKVETAPVVTTAKSSDTTPSISTNNETVKFVTKYREMVTVIGKQSVDLFLEYTKTNADELLRRGLITQIEYDEAMKELNSGTREEMQAALGMMYAFGMGSYDASLPNDKFLNKDEVVTINKEGNKVSIKVEVNDPENTGRYSQTFDFVADPKDGTVFTGVDF